MTHTETLVSSEMLERFAKLLEAERLAHAYLFIGPKRIGKLETALAAAKLVNCDNPSAGKFCGVCPACIKIDKGYHPDIHLSDKDDPLLEANEKNVNKSIGRDHIVSLIGKMQLRAFEAKTKVFIIKDVEFVTPDACNTFLKTLEEPPRNTLIILTTSLIDSVLPTIRSRCQVFYFFPLSAEELKKKFLAEKRFNDAEARFFAYFSQGCPGRVEDGEHKEILKRRNEAIDQFIFSANDDPYLKKILADRSQTAEMLGFLYVWFKDLMMLALDLPAERIINADRVNDLKTFKNRYSFEELENILDKIVQTRKALEDNFNVKIPLALLKETIWKK